MTKGLLSNNTVIFINCRLMFQRSLIIELINKDLKESRKWSLIASQIGKEEKNQSLFGSWKHSCIVENKDRLQERKEKLS